MRPLRPATIAALLLFAPAAFAGPDGATPQAKTSSPSDVGQYSGPGSCSATSCHGSIRPREDSRILQTEYSTWVVKDKHSRAYLALTGQVGERMARILKLGTKAEESPKCLVCHSLSVPADKRARTFELNEGVSCENCHGPAGGWLGGHTTRGWTHEQSLKLGMYDTRNLIHRTDKCLTCHLGTPEQFVDHEMIAGGHPDLYFELDSFSAAMPRHWKVPRESAPGQPAENVAWLGMREWGTGQAEQLRAELERASWRAKGKIWPEYSELDCFACHHALGPAAQSWRQEHGYPGRRPGDPPWNASRYIVFQHLASAVDASAAQDLAAKMATFEAEMNKLNPNPDAVVSAAGAAAPVAQHFAEKLETLTYDAALAKRAMASITGDAENISYCGERCAEQATMALDSLFIAYSKEVKASDAAEVRAAINGLFPLIENQSYFEPAAFANQLRKVGALVR
ncbi:MAG TPA: multiheme c-type cytochrome [Candidatus Acidoferrales bacterium]|nr:multiheme c-type cytochrome [Candidatus Acidoferrales bacterium]